MNKEELKKKIISLYNSKQNYQALSHCVDFLNSYPDDLSILTYKSLILKNLKRTVEAKNILTELISKNYELFYLWSFRGDCYFEELDYFNAFSDYWVSVKLEDYGAGYDKCARALFLLGNSDYALFMMDKAIIKEESPEPLLVMIEMLRNKGHTEYCNQLLKKGRDIFPQDSRFIS